MRGVLSLALLSPWGCAWVKSGMHCSCSPLSKLSFQLRLEQEIPGGFSLQGEEDWISTDFRHLNPVLSPSGGKFSDNGRFWTHTLRLEIQEGTSGTLFLHPQHRAQRGCFVRLLDQTWDLQEVEQEPVPDSDWEFPPADVPVESLRLRFALLQSLNTTLETFFLPLVELRQTDMYGNSIAALLQEAKGQLGSDPGAPRLQGTAPLVCF